MTTTTADESTGPEPDDPLSEQAINDPSTYLRSLREAAPVPGRLGPDVRFHAP